MPTRRTNETSRLEQVTQTLVISRLQHEHLVVAEPKTDSNGTDLLALLAINDSARFCRIQCKGRSLAKGRSSVLIEEAYVSPGYIVLLHIEERAYSQDLYCFFATDVQAWPLTPRGKYRLELKANTYRQTLAPYSLTSERMGLLKALIRKADAADEIRHLSLQAALGELAEYRCSTCGSSLNSRVEAPADPEERHWDLREVFACGYQTFGGTLERPCPRDPRFPSIDDYTIDCRELPKEPHLKWECHAIGKTAMARLVDLPVGYAASRDEAQQVIFDAYARYKRAGNP